MSGMVNMDVHVQLQEENCESEGAGNPKQPVVEGNDNELLGQKCEKVENVNNGLTELEKQGSESKGQEKLKVSEDVPQNSSTEEATFGFEEKEPSPADVAQNINAEQNGPLLKNVKMKSVENIEGPRHDMQVVLALPYLGTPMQLKAKGTPVQLRMHKSTSKVAVNSKQVLRARLQEKPKASDVNNTAANTVAKDNGNGEKKRRGRKKKQMEKSPADEFSRTRNHLKYLLHRIKYEQSLIDAYSTEGWKGQSVDKLKPEKELQRARSHILSYKLRIRELFQRLDLSLAVGKLPESLFDAEGEIDSEDIFCAKCGSKDLQGDNDIILCDGACERGFHLSCLEPPLLKEDIPPDDQGWLCPGCDCKVDCIELLKDVHGTKLSMAESWKKVFPEAAASGKKLDDGSGSSSDDSDDADYDPEKPDIVEKVSGDESSSDESGDEPSSDESGDKSSSDGHNYFSASDNLMASPNNTQYLGLPSDDSEDDDFDPIGQDQDEQVKQESSSSDFTSDSEDLGALLDDAAAPDKAPEDILPPLEDGKPCTGSDKENSKAGKVNRQSLKGELLYLLETNDSSLTGKRQVERLDYKKLHDEEYGNTSSDSSDEDFEDIVPRKRRKIEKIDVMSPDESPFAKNKMNAKVENQKASEHMPKRMPKKLIDGGTNKSPAEGSSGGGNVKRSAFKRLGEAATQILFETFRNTQYPGRAIKENLAKELGLTVQQVNKWFMNTRSSFNHRQQMESNLTKSDSKMGSSSNQDNEKQSELEQATVTVDSSSNGVVSLQEPKTGSPQNLNTLARAENLVTPKPSRKRIGDDISSDDNSQEHNVPVDTSPSQVRQSSRLNTSSSAPVA